MSINSGDTKESSASRGFQEQLGITLSGCLRIIADAIDRVQPTRFMPVLPTWRPTNSQLFELVISELITMIRDNSPGISSAEFYHLDFPGVALQKVMVMGRRDSGDGDDDKKGKHLHGGFDEPMAPLITPAPESMTPKPVDKGKAPIRASNDTARPSKAGGPSSARQERALGPASNSPVLPTPSSSGTPGPSGTSRISSTPQASKTPRPTGSPRIHGGFQTTPIEPLAYGYGSRYGYAPPNYTSPNNILPAMYPSPQAYSSPSSVYPQPGLPPPLSVHMQPTAANANIHTAGMPASNGQSSLSATPGAHAVFGSPRSMDVQVNAGSREYNDKMSWQPFPNAPYMAVPKQTAPKTAGISDKAANTQIPGATKEQRSRGASPDGQSLRASNQPSQPLSQQSPSTTNAVQTKANRKAAAEATPAQIQSSSAEKRKAEVLDRVEECPNAVIVQSKPETLGEALALNTAKFHGGTGALDRKKQTESSRIGQLKSSDVSEKPQAKITDVVQSYRDTSENIPAEGAYSDERASPIETELPYGLGSTDPCPTAVHMEPFPTPAEKKPQDDSDMKQDKGASPVQSKSQDANKKPQSKRAAGAASDSQGKPQDADDKELDKSAAAANQVKSETAAVSEEAKTEIEAPSSSSSCDAWSAMSREFEDWEVIDNPKEPSPAVKKSFRVPDGRRGSESPNGFRAKESENPR